VLALDLELVSLVVLVQVLVHQGRELAQESARLVLEHALGLELPELECVQVSAAPVPEADLRQVICRDF
jgi:hypothetical protein